MEIDLLASDAPLEIWVEPWGDLVTVAEGDSVRLVITGELIESLGIEAGPSNRLRLSVPRHGLLTIHSGSGERLGQYDTSELPPVPDGLRP